MRLQVKSKNVELSPALKDYAQKRLARLEKHLNDSARVELELAAERNPSIGQSQVAEATVWTKGPILRARESSHDMKASIDLLVDKLERQAQRLREKRRRGRGGEREPAAGPQSEADAPGVVKTKQFAVKLELIGHDFFVFQNGDSGEVNVVYRRRDGNYGLIEPQLL
jgi:putative sigma-54 modulation protein